MVAEQEIKAGTHFTVEVPPTNTIEEIRQMAKAKYGREIHIRMKIGPVTHSGTEIGCPMEAVDDKFITGSINRWPKNAGHYLLVGYFK